MGKKTKDLKGISIFPGIFFLFFFCVPLSFFFSFFFLGVCQKVKKRTSLGILFGVNFVSFWIFLASFEQTHLKENRWAWTSPQGTGK